MRENDAPASIPEKSAAFSATPGSDEAQPAIGSEISLGDFTRTQGLMKSLRLTLGDQIVVQVDEVGSGVGEAGRKFKMGDIEQAHQDVARLYSTFGQKVSQWESQARGLEQQMRMQAAKNPKSISIEKMNRMKSEQVAVRSRIRTAEIQFRRLHQGLTQAFTTLQRQLAPALPLGFLTPFKASVAEERPAVVKEWFDVAAVLQADVSRGTAGGYDVRFDPLPPAGRLYFLTTSAEVVYLHRLGHVVLVRNVETGQSSEMKLAEFVRHVHGGVWLLQPRQAP